MFRKRWAENESRLAWLETGRSGYPDSGGNHQLATAVWHLASRAGWGATADSWQGTNANGGYRHGMRAASRRYIGV